MITDRLMGNQTNEHSESKLVNDKLLYGRKSGLCGVLLDRAVKNRHITKCFKRTSYCNTVLIIRALRFQYKRYPLHVVLGYVFGKTSRYTCRGHKRSSGRERYPSPIQAFVTFKLLHEFKRAHLQKYAVRISPTWVFWETQIDSESTRALLARKPRY